MHYRPVTARDWLKTGLLVVLMIAVTVVAAVLLSELGWPGMVLWAAVFLGSLLLLVKWHAANTVYRCQACGNVFSISMMTDAISPHLLDRKYLKCPECGKRSWATVLMRDDA
jgi:DNA-directed RNA polymerase subunit RPC12/RpoP